MEKGRERKEYGLAGLHMDTSMGHVEARCDGTGAMIGTDAAIDLQLAGEDP